MTELRIDPDTVLWSADTADRTGHPLLVLLHGYGADERDLFGLTPYLPSAFVFAAPRAPLSPPWPAPGFSWYPIEGLERRDPTHVTAAAAAFIDWVHAQPGHDTIGLLGFSQGAAIALQALRLRPDLFDFAVNLSGYASPGELPSDGELAGIRPPVFWGRGTADDVIPPELVEHTTQWLPQHSDLSGRVYAGLTHSVSEQELDDVRLFLDKRLSTPETPG
ncbi:MAG: alpha/beta hydrolase [Microbacterium sp.]|uniref:alpha/beta hydrolase n=1 Tax=Microbacterium sp. TaxID=51671 RepID=UPI003A869296